MLHNPRNPRALESGCVTQFGDFFFLYENGETCQDIRGLLSVGYWKDIHPDLRAFRCRFVVAIDWGRQTLDAIEELKKQMPPADDPNQEGRNVWLSALKALEEYVP